MEYFIKMQVLKRIKQILSHKNMATYKLPRKVLVERLNEIFWSEAKPFEGFWNKQIYGRAITQMNNAIQNGHTFDSCKTNLKSILDSRSEEIISFLVDGRYLVSDSDNPPSYYIRSVNFPQFLWLFKWIIINILVLGFFVAIIANLTASYIWDKIKIT